MLWQDNKIANSEYIKQALYLSLLCACIIIFVIWGIQKQSAQVSAR